MAQCKRLSESMANCETCGLSKNPRNLDYLFMMAQIAFDKKKYVDCIVVLGAYEAEQQRQHSGQMQYDNMLLDFWDAGSAKHYLLGMAYLKLDRHTDARDAFVNGVLMDGQNKTLWELYIHCCDALGDTDAVSAGVAEMWDRGLA